MNPRHFHLIASSLLVLAILGACGSSPAKTNSTAVAPAQGSRQSANGDCSNAYFPVSTGNKWSYASNGGALGTYTYSWTVTQLENTGFTTNNTYSTGVNATVKWNCRNGNLAALDAGSNSLSFSTSKVTMTSNSITVDGYNIPASFATGNTWSEKVTVNGTVTNTKSQSVDTRIVTQSDCSVAGADTVTVPAGKFEAVKITCSVSIAVSALMQGTAEPAGAPVNESVTNWYAKGVGLVESNRTGGTNGTEDIVLTQYKVQ